MIFIRSNIRDTRNIYNYNLLPGRKLLYGNFGECIVFISLICIYKKPMANISVLLDLVF